MATKRRIPLNRIENVGAGKTAVIELPRNVRYHGICLIYGTDTAGGANQTNMEAEIGDIFVDINEVTQRTASAAELFAINKSKGADFSEGALPIFFSEPQRNTQVERELTSWGMQGVEDFQIRVDIKDNSGQAAALSGFAIVDDVVQAPGGIVKWKRNKITNNATGPLPYNLPKVRGDSYQGVYLFEDTANDIADILIEWDGVKVHDLSDAEQAAYIEYFTNQIQAVADVHHIAFDNNVPTDALRTVKQTGNGVQEISELLLTLEMAAANPVTVIREMLGAPD